MAMMLFLSPAHADISGAIISVSISPANPVEGGSLTGSCSANNSSGVTNLQYQWQKNDSINVNGTAVFGSSVAVGNEYTCAIRQNDSRVLCWGQNDHGQLGDGTMTDRPDPTLINSTAAFASVAAGYGYTCAIQLNNSRLICWGIYYIGDSINPKLINDTSAFSSVSVNVRHACAIRTNDSRVMCWGDNSWGALGDGTTSSHGGNLALTSDTAAYAAVSAAGDSHTCAIRANDSRILCWGLNNIGQLGDGTTSDMYNPTPITNTDAYSSITTGYSHNCAIRANDSRVLCWGENTNGQLGDGSITQRNNPTQVNYTSNFTSVSTGSYHTCAIRTNDSSVICWGSNTYGQLGDGTTSDKKAPSQIANNAAHVALGVGDFDTCSIRQNDTRVMCWGDNTYGQLGDGTTVMAFAPVLTTSALNFTSISVGSSTTCAIRQNDSRVMCWGYNSAGQIGDGTSSQRSNPTLTNNTAAFTSVSAGGTTCAIRASDSHILCWGDNGDGGLGIGTSDYTAHKNPVQINDTSAFTAVSTGTGSIHACAIRANDSRVLCWGANYRGAVGDGSYENTIYVPTLTTDTSAYKAISAGSDHTCAIRNDSRLLCWGSNEYGQLGDGTITHRHEPTLINDTSGFSAVTAGSSHTCAIRANDSRVLCWGDNRYGKLGDGSLLQRMNPTLINDTSNYTSVGLGYGHTCAIRANDSRVMCWGRSANGQLGGGLKIVQISDQSAFDSFLSGKPYTISTIPVSAPSRGSTWVFSCRAATPTGNSSWTNASTAMVSAPATGNASSINATGTTNLTVQINGITNISGTGFGENATVNISSAEGIVLLFNYNFTLSGLDFTSISMENGTDNSKVYTIVSGINTSALVGTKTIYIYNADPSYTQICIKDEEGASYSDITASCTGTNEHILTCNGTLQSNYTCSMNNTTITVAGLTHSAVAQFSPPVAPSTGGSSYRTPSLAYSFNCSSGSLAITAKTSGEPISGLEVRLKDPAQTGWLATAATDSQGTASFAITTSRRYSAETAQTSGYFQAYLEPVLLTLCPASQPQSAGNATQPPAVAPQPPAAPEQPKSNPAPAPLPQAGGNKTATAPTAGTPASGATTAPKAATGGNAGSLPAAPQAASNALKDTAAPAISLAAIGTGIAIVLAAIVGYMFFSRKKK